MAWYTVLGMDRWLGVCVNWILDGWNALDWLHGDWQGSLEWSLEACVLTLWVAGISIALQFLNWKSGTRTLSLWADEEPRHNSTSLFITLLLAIRRYQSYHYQSTDTVAQGR